MECSDQKDFSFLPTRRICHCPPTHLNCLSRQELARLGSTVLDVKPRYRWGEKHSGRFIPELPSKYIQLFSHRGETVLDPFCGSGTTTLVALSLGRHSIGIDVSPRSIQTASHRMAREVSTGSQDPLLLHRLIQGSAVEVLPLLPTEGIDLVVTSPPYFDIVDYEDTSAEQWGNIHYYPLFLEKMTETFRLVFDVIKKRGWFVINTQDVFKRHIKAPMHVDYVVACRKIGFEIISTQVYILNYSTGGRLVFGYPSSYYPKNDHEYLLIFQKP